MNEKLDHADWANYFNEFTKRNQLRPTKLEVFGDGGAQEEERGLPFGGISIEQQDGTDGRDEALEIVSAEGETSLLRFEPQTMIAN